MNTVMSLIERMAEVLKKEVKPEALEQAFPGIPEEVSRARETLVRMVDLQERLLANLRATGEILLTGRDVGDPVFDNWKERFAEFPDALPLLASAVNAETAEVRKLLSLSTVGTSRNGKDIVKRERAVVAFSYESMSAVVLQISGAHLEAHMTGLAAVTDAAGDPVYDVTDPSVLGIAGHAADPAEGGVWVWGAPVVDGALDAHRAHWRPPTLEEWNNLVRHRLLWAPAFPDGVPDALVPDYTEETRGGLPSDGATDIGMRGARSFGDEDEDEEDDMDDDDAYDDGDADDDDDEDLDVDDDDDDDVGEEAGGKRRV